jgi:hypothetical protein
MFETVLERRRRIERFAREFVDLSACRVVTQWQQLGAALGFAALGAIAALMWADRRAEKLAAAAAVFVLDPKIERAGNPAIEGDYSIYRLRFSWQGNEITPCHLVAWHTTGKWSLRC